MQKFAKRWQRHQGGDDENGEKGCNKKWSVSSASISGD
jgi:hypothetical protein